MPHYKPAHANSPQTTRMRRPTHEYELLPASEGPDALQRPTSRSTWLQNLYSTLPGVDKLTNRSVYAHYVTPRRRKRSVLRCIYWSIFSIPYLCLFLVLIAGTLFPSYTHQPAHYNALRQRAVRSSTPGRANVNNEKIFIAASIYEEEGLLSSGAWGRSVLELIDLLGPDNVHLSIYENDADALTKESLARFEKSVTCNSTILAEDLDLSTLPRVALPNGDTRIKRIAFLAEVRNRALAPLASTPVPFDRILYINDVNFDPIDAAQLLLSTNLDPATGRADYGAACAVDFINAFKFYDRFALRDMEGYNPGIPFFPWFTSEGNAISRNDVLSGTDAVRVRSCWGGMTAFEAKWFQDRSHLSKKDSISPPATTDPIPSPLRFRYDGDTFWDSSECCLINADLSHLSGPTTPTTTPIYMNPYIRVAYDPKTLSWLNLTRRSERLYSLIHDILNHFVGFPSFNERRTEEPGQEVVDRVWEYNDPAKGFMPNATEVDHEGRWTDVKRVAGPGGFCGTRQLLFINEKPGPGEERWGKILPPSPPG
ncbi:hypothetical protein P280DRAFT_474340 [Massarina eburnea CBS 473.64]|uniref:Glycosyltransferase family 69 protein n=1 Tax=Massarina eburnea CBS 473.64 TaxID=1395130 RepID=A0A6A6RHI4_9PLEO|nr:hypothetical protein P280DRAFT_474340 [Massarina eburnea CBS 473.64]